MVSPENVDHVHDLIWAKELLKECVEFIIHEQFGAEAFSQVGAKMFAF